MNDIPVVGNKAFPYFNILCMSKIWVINVGQETVNGFVENFQKACKDHPFDGKDNLQCEVRTGWRTQELEYLRPYYMNILSNVSGALINESDEPQNISINIRDSWIALYNNNSFVHPHTHTKNVNGYSVSLYLNPGDNVERTHLYFWEATTGFRVKVQARSGDMLLFPSSISHYTEDCHEGRMIVSANFLVNVEVVNDE